MFWIGLIMGSIIGANLTIILYACIIAGKNADERIIGEEKEYE